MPVHDWTRVSAGTFHAFHNAWITHLQEALNSGCLPSSYYALGEQRSGDIGPNVLTLHAQPQVPESGAVREDTDDFESGSLAVAVRPPVVSQFLEAEKDVAFYLEKRRTIVIYHSSGDRIVAMIELLSPGNKQSRYELGRFTDKIIGAFNQGYHLLLIDLFPPNGLNPSGIHGCIWEYMAVEPWKAPPGLPLTLVSYCAKQPVTAYLEPICVNRAIPDMPLFLTPERYVNVPLEATYQRAWDSVPERWRRVIE